MGFNNTVFYKSFGLFLALAISFQSPAVFAEVNSLDSSHSCLAAKTEIDDKTIKELFNIAAIFLISYDFFVSKNYKHGKEMAAKCAEQAKVVLREYFGKTEKNVEKIQGYYKNIDRIDGLYMEDGVIYLTLDKGRLKLRFTEPGKSFAWDRHKIIAQEGPLKTIVTKRTVNIQIVREKKPEEISAELVSLLRKNREEFVRIFYKIKAVVGDSAYTIFDSGVTPDDIDALFEMTLNKDRPFRDVAVIILRLYGIKHFTPLVKGLSHVNRDIRIRASEALSFSDDPESVRHLIGMLKDSDRPVRSTASSALGMPLSEKNSQKKPEIQKLYIKYLLENRLLDYSALPLIANMDVPTKERLIQNLIYRHEEIKNKTIKAEDIIFIYANGQFISQTTALGFGPANQYSLARGIDITLKRFEVPLTAKNVETAMNYILEARTANLDKGILDKDTNLIIILGAEKLSDLDGIEKFAQDLGIKNITVLKGTDDKETILRAIASAPTKTTLWFSADVNPASIKLRNGVEMYFNELAERLRAYSARQGNNMDGLRILMNACQAASFMASALNLTAIGDTPITIASSNRGEITKGNALLDNLQKVVKGRVDSPTGDRTVRFRDYCEAEEASAESQDFAFLLPIPQWKLQRLMADLGAKKGSGSVVTRPPAVLTLDNMFTAINLLPEKPMIDLFEPLTQPGAVTTEGEIIGRGIKFETGVGLNEICDYLLDAGEVTGPERGKIIPVIEKLQTYFKMINEVYPDKTRNMLEFKIEFRKKVKNYAILETEGDISTLVIDTALLKLDVDSQDLLFFLLFVLGHEGAHKLTAAVTPEEKSAASRQFDMERFNALNAAHQTSVIKVFEQLVNRGAELDRAYLLELLSYMKPPALARLSAEDTNQSVISETVTQICQ